MSDQFNDRNRYRGRYTDEDIDYEGGYGRQARSGHPYPGHRGRYYSQMEQEREWGGVSGRGTDDDWDYRNYPGRYRSGSYSGRGMGSEMDQPYGGYYGRAYDPSMERGRDPYYGRGAYGRGQDYGRYGYGGGYGFQRDYPMYDTDYEFDTDYDMDYEFNEPISFSYVEYWMIPGPESGRGPQGYKRDDTRIHEDVCDRLMQHGRIDASDIDVQVNNGEVTLSGTVNSRQAKRMAENVTESVPGVTDIHNQLKAKEHQQHHEGQGQGQAQGQVQSPGQTRQTGP